MLSRTFASKSLFALAALVAGCAAGDGIENPAGATGPGSGGGTANGTGNGGAGGSSGTDATSSSSKSSTSVGEPSSSDTSTGTTSSSTTSSSDGGGNPDGGGSPDGGGPSAGGGGQGGDQGSGGAPPDPVCGDGEKNGVEDCDGSDLDGESCDTIDLGFIGGTLSCSDRCTFDTTGCTAPPDCGNGVVEGTEECDGAQLDGHTCQSEGFDTGTISCSAGCALDVSACSSCGNDIIEADELCDGTDLGGVTCTGLGHDGGTLGCNAACDNYVQTACSDCGDGQVEAPEDCDGNNFAGETCATQGNFNGGTLLCTQACGTISTVNCYNCGDGSVTGNEVCDGANTDGATCASLGFEVGGTLGCNANCLTYNTASCVDSQCNDGIDNDGDGFADLGDVGCSGSVDASEVVYANNCGGNGGPINDITLADTETNYYYVYNSSASPSAFTGSCGGSGRELIFVYRSPIAQPWIYFETDVAETQFDTLLYVRNGSCTGGQLGCNDDIDVFNGNYNSSVMVSNVAAGQLLFIFVDAFDSGVGGQFGIAVYPESAND